MAERPISERAKIQAAMLEKIRTDARTQRAAGSRFLNLNGPEARSLFEAFDLPILPEMENLLASNETHIDLNVNPLANLKTTDRLKTVALVSYAFITSSIKPTPKE